MIDWHCHILPGLDDGARSLSEAIEIAGILSARGFTEVYCTPHAIRGLYDNTPVLVRQAVVDLQAAIDSAGIVLLLHAGMEYFLDEYLTQYLVDLLPLGETNYVLVETSPQADPEQVKDQLFAIRRRGFTPILAHPERYTYISSRKTRERRGLFDCLKDRIAPKDKCLPHTPSLLKDLRDMGCLFQGDLGSFAGTYGKEAKGRAEKLFAEGGYYCFGSDAHRAESLTMMLENGLARVKK